MKTWWWNISFLLLLTLVGTGCSERYGTPVYTADSTLVYLPKDTGNITANIVFYRKKTSKTGELIGEGNIFIAMERENIRAMVMLENVPKNRNKILMFHLDWIGPDNHSFYRKKIILTAGDTAKALHTSISAEPQVRDPGNYKLKVYLFRELIAEKKLTLFPEFRLTKTPDEEIKANITLYRYRSKKTGKRIGEGKAFKRKKKAHVRADIHIENRFAYGHRELLLHLHWIGPDNNIFYPKKIDFPAGDSTTNIRSSVSIAPDKRKPGKYRLEVYLFKELTGKTEFELK